MYISAWTVYTDGLTSTLKDAVDSNKVSPDETVWVGPSGDAVAGDDAYELQYADYTDAGLVSEYL